jgi:hypothetical protein
VGIALVLILAGLIALLRITNAEENESTAKEAWSANFFKDWGLDGAPTYVNTRATRTGDNDMDYWYQLQLPPSEIQGFRQLLLSKLRPTPAHWRIDDNTGIHLDQKSPDCPSWWQPDRLADADYICFSYYGGGDHLAGAQYLFVLSKQTGIVYVHRSSV